jgi:hypothetical protein
MEKLFEFKKGKLWDENTRVYRFQCDCTTAADAMDITVDSWGKDDEEKFVIITMNFLGTSLWDRIKYALQILRGQWNWREFIPRPEDYGNLSEIFDPNKKYSELP